MTSPASDSTSAGELVAGLVAAATIAASGIALVHKPLLTAPIAIVLALLAVGMGGRRSRLPLVALTVASLGWMVGMTIAVLSNRPLY